MKKILTPHLIAAVISLLLFSCTKPEQRGLKRNILIVGWDGVRRDVVSAMMKEGAMPNLSALAREGSFIPLEIREGRTETKPGWAQILTGYNVVPLGILSNMNYKSLPPGSTVFERVRKFFGDSVFSIFVSSKPDNLSGRGPHRVCSNCYQRNERMEQTDWWKEPSTAPTGDGKARLYEAREAEPYFHAKDSVDYYEVDLGPAEKVYDAFHKQLLRMTSRQTLFAFVHYGESDDWSHIYGWTSAKEREAMLIADRYLGKMIQDLRERGLYESSSIIVTTDHGFDDIAVYSHRAAPHIWLATNEKNLKQSGDRRDLAPTIYELLKLPLKDMRPPLDGASLLAK